MTHFYSAESVTAGHPDKLCDQIADTVLDGCLALDRNARVACEVLATKGHIILAGEISTAVMPDLGKLTREALENAGYNPKDFEIESLIHPQSPDIEAAVNDPLDAESDPNAIGAGDQCVVVGYATDETPEMLPLPVVLAHRLTSRLTWACINDEQKRFGPDGKAMAIVEYEDERPVRVARIVVSFQHAPEVDPTDLTELIWQNVILSALKGMPYDDSLELILNPGGHFVLGGPDADTGLTGRKLAVDAYGPFVPTGGGAFSGKDPTKLDRSGAYMARCVAKKHCGQRHRTAMPGHADLRHRHGKAAGGGGGHLRHRPALRGRLPCGGGAKRVRPDPGRHHYRTGPAAADLRPYRGGRPLWPRRFPLGKARPHRPADGDHTVICPASPKNRSPPRGG